MGQFDGNGDGFMMCDYQLTSEIHRSGRLICRCSRSPCTNHGLMPHSGNVSQDLRATCTGTPRWHEFGNILEVGLQVIGVTKASWGGLTGQIAGCSRCPQTQEKMNTIGSRFATFLQNLRSKITTYRL